jgi:hypothetical protein
MHQIIISEYKDFSDISANILNGDFYIPFLNIIRDNKSFYRACLQTRNSFPIATGYEPLMEYVIKPACHTIGITDDAEIIYHFIFYQAGFTFVLKRWVDNDCKESSQEIASYLKKCLSISIPSRVSAS